MVATILDGSSTDGIQSACDMLWTMPLFLTIREGEGGMATGLCDLRGKRERLERAPTGCSKGASRTPSMLDPGSAGMDLYCW